MSVRANPADCASLGSRPHRQKHGAITILGGPHLTLMPHESMEKPEVDLVVRGEGEYTIIEIMRVLEKEAEIGDWRLEVEKQNLISNLQSPRLFNPEAGWGRILGLSWRDKEGKSSTTSTGRCPTTLTPFLSRRFTCSRLIATPTSTR
ncbi:MAG: hypothetical protein HC875_35725 [Anaerolineales bacterium]|nr:hypothetical protein [Anaerolineales bacterium]